MIKVNELKIDCINKKISQSNCFNTQKDQFLQPQQDMDTLLAELYTYIFNQVLDKLHIDLNRKYQNLR